MAKVTLKNIYKVYSKGQEAVKNVSFTAEAGEFVVLVGPSGCGKTTILRMISGLEDISGGELYFDDALMNNTLPKDRDVGMVFQNYALYPHLNVFDNIAFPLSIRKEKKSHIKAHVQEIARMIGLEEYLHRKPKELSGGQRQRVALGRAIVRKPRVFLFDEPLSNLDAKLRVQMRSEISNLHRQLGITSIYVTHDQVEAMTMGTKLVVLKDGEIQQIDTPNNIYDQPANEFVAGFIGSPQINFFRGNIDSSDGLQFSETGSSDTINISGNIFAKGIPGSRDSITLALRPEQIFLEPAGLAEYASINARVINVEYVGHEVLVYFSTGGEIKCCRTTKDFSDSLEGTTVTFYLNTRKFLAFDKNGNRI